MQAVVVAVILVTYQVLWTANPWNGRRPRSKVVN